MQFARGAEPVIRVVIGHHGKLVRGALAVVLSKEPDLTVVGEFDRADELLGVSGADVVVLDPLLLGEMGVAELCTRLAGRALLMLVERDEGGSISLALSVVKQSPKVGVIATDASPDDLVDAVRGVAEGRPVFDVSLALAVLRADDNPLTDRECEVLRLIGTGATAQDVAATLCLSAGTVRNYLSRILSKTDARSRIEAIRKAQDAGWI
ncbi:LuxR C-terminal-related transcriptional regulator [Kribbella sp. CA-253562]|uniref:LuxR C-terminal-related transcriptional regulator n=1 Tax=Kribbella sp. CA-253562 TaxID=3239942 RepID=UPI003D916FF3